MYKRQVDVSIQSFDAASGQLSFTATGQGAERLNEFVEALQNTGIFLNVTYSGYNLIESTGIYNVNGRAEARCGQPPAPAPGPPQCGRERRRLPARWRAFTFQAGDCLV